MTPWTQAAQAELARYCSRIRPDLVASGADPDEVIEDLRRHVQAEADAAGLSSVTEQDLRHLLAKIGAPAPADSPPGPAAPAAPPVAAVTASHLSPLAAVLLMITGIVLPSATLMIEALTGMCAGAFFDPMPTWGHGVLVTFLIAANIMAWTALRGGNVRHPVFLGWANGVAIAIAGFYSLLFIPLVLPGVFAIIVFGWGLLPLSPLMALIATVVLRNRLRQSLPSPASGLPGFWRGLLIGLAALALVEAPGMLTRVGMDMAISESRQTQQKGIHLLRRTGDNDLLLRACYGFTRNAQSMDLRMSLISGDTPVSAEQAREIYYQVNGTAFNAVPAPRVSTGRGEWSDLNDWTWDADHGGDKVGGRIRGLTLNSSRIDTAIDADAAWSYSEWTLEFRNDASQTREARAQILLPPGGVVSRLTLWVNGEEREAAFAGRSHVREAYQEIAVQQRRDPVLVTTSGPDRVMMQCFPVPPGGGLMKVRLGITAPLALESRAKGYYRLPALVERNFSIPEDTQHAVWVESSGTPTNRSGWLEAEARPGGSVPLHGLLSNQQLASPPSLIEVARDPAMTHAWTRDTRQGDDRFVRQTIHDTPPERPSRVVVVLDASQGMSAYTAPIANALATLHERVPLHVLAASDGVLSLSGDPVETVRSLTCQGGQDNVPALIAARDMASETEGAIIVWIHAPQPILIASPEPLLQAYERRPDGPVIHEIQVIPGPDRVVNGLNGLSQVHSVLRTGSVDVDLLRLFGRWTRDEGALSFHRVAVDQVEEATAQGAIQTSLHLARLWAAQDVNRLRSQRNLEAAVNTAARYQLVTPVSGAVVLENAQQYAQTGLEAVDPQSVPSIPEPSSFALLLIGALTLLVARRQWRC